MSRDNGLPPKEGALFKSIVKHYETKQYKKGIKAADAVLKKFPDHGETLAMKGLILNCQERKTEAYELVRKGVKQDIKSHVCWHVYGLLYRSDREYLQAIKCYRGALRHDPDNVQILRDLSLLQVQMRDLPGFVSTRQHLLSLQPTNRNNWFTFAVSQHLQGRVTEAIGIVDAYERTLEGAPENEYEHSEMLLYKNMMLEEVGKDQEALDHLEKHADEICDKLFHQEKRAELLLKLDRHAEAEAIYRNMLRRNPEHYGYHAGLQACVLKAKTRVEHWLEVEQLPSETENALKALYAELQHQHPRSSVTKRLPLDFARDESHFRVAAKTYMLPPLRKGVPSLFADLKPLYKDAMKSKVLGEIFEDWLATLESEGKLRGEKQKEMPTTMLWIKSLLSQHYDIMGNTAKALALIDEAIEHTPTLLDLCMIKARMYKHAGALTEASEWMDRARKMDLQDRYLNTKATRYMLRNDQVEEAKTTVALFTKDGDDRSNLFDMQCMWYELEIARSHRRLGEMGKALKNFTWVDKHFTDILEDQFDFHTYCIRKMTLRAYVRMLRMEDSIYGHTFYTQAAAGAIEAYIALYDKPKEAEKNADQEAEDGMSAAEKKKAESKRKKAEAKAKAEAEAKAKAEAEAAAKAEKEGGNKKGKGKAAAKERVEDPDPDGVELAAAEDPLEKASGFLRTLQTAAPSALKTHTLACELFMRKGRHLLVLRALLKAVAIAPDDPAVHVAKVRFLHAVSSASLAPALKSVIDGKRDAIGAPAAQSLDALNKAFLLKAQAAAKAAKGSASGGGDASASALLAAASMQLLIDPKQSAAALALVTTIDPSSLSLPLAVEVHATISAKFADASAASAFKDKALKAFPLASCFAPPPAAAA